MLNLSACVDDWYVPSDRYGEGSGELAVSVTFSPVLNALNGDDTRAAGDALKHINSLCLFMYNEDGSLFRRIPVTEDVVGTITKENNDKTAGDAVDSGKKEDQAETKTPLWKFHVKDIPYGRYRIYAVANMGLFSEEKDKEIYEDAENLKAQRLVWNEDDIAANDQMFGYFTHVENETSQGFDAPLITVNRNPMPLHAWVKRAASKVTVAIDGSKLHPGVNVWIKKIQIRDIPGECWLGKDNVAQQYNLIPDGESFILGSDNEERSGEQVNRERNYPLEIKNAHTETANALYFYENMQGIGQNKAQAWTPNATKPEFPDGNSPDSQGFKDSKRAGTFIEVTAHYEYDGSPNESGISRNKSEGTIIYRFMLGKDVTTNYDAQRNYHYKLTLCLKNYADDNDWHIVYNPEPKILLPDPFFLSYLYDEPSVYSFKIEGYKLISLRADINDNEMNKNSWHPIQSQIKDTDKPYPYWTGTPDNAGPWNGFLSLKKVTEPAFGLWPNKGDNNKYGPSEEVTYTYNKTRWDEKGLGTYIYLDRDKGDIPSENMGTDAEGKYSIIQNGSEWIAKVPLTTRARVMVSQTAYTGNNPYVSYQRQAQVKFTAVVEDINGTRHTVSENVTVKQARRIENPKGVWRPHDSTKPFDVELKILPYESSEEFENIYSLGPWRAEVEVGKDWISLSPSSNSMRNPDGSISGTGDQYPKHLKDKDGLYTDEWDLDDKDNPGRQITFQIKPTSTIGANESRGGVIKILYNNYSCVHRIYVRQGYAPVAFKGTTCKWHSFNLKTKDTEVSDPVLEGSYFRQYNLDQPIAASNNTVPTPFELVSNLGKNLALATGGTVKWEKMEPKTSWQKITINGKVCRFATKDELNLILFGKKTPDANTTTRANISYGYGVLYSETSTKTASLKADVYGAREDNYSEKGMRGLFICDLNDGTQIFLPLSVSGYGRFKQKCESEVYNRLPSGYGAVVQYANRYEEFPAVPDAKTKYPVAYRPLFWDLYRRPGVLYWLSGSGTTQGIIDINYYTMDLSNTDAGNVGVNWGKNADPSGSDAILLRLVED